MSHPVALPIEAVLGADLRAARRRAALVAGLALVLMVVLGGFANFFAVPPAGTVSTAGDLLFRAGIVALVAVAALDVVVAAALRELFASVDPTLATLAAWFRLAYAAVLVAATGSLLGAVRTGTGEGEALASVAGFHEVWMLGLGLFGVHLVLVGVLVLRSRFVHPVFGGLLVVAGGGYLLDTLGAVLFPHLSLGVARFAFVGEVLFILWLLLRGTRLPAEPGR